MIYTFINDLSSQFLRFLERKIPTRNWTLKISIFAALLSLLFAFPYIHGYMHGGFENNWLALDTQFKAPFEPVEYAFGSHASNITFRVTIPILASLIGFTREGSFIIQYIAFFILFYLFASLARTALKDHVAATLATLAFAFIFAGNILCADIRGFFDVVSFALILGAMRAKHPLIVFLCLILAGFNDERTLIASVFVFLWHLRHHWEKGSFYFRDFFKVTPIWIAIITSWLVYFGIRFYMVQTFELSAGASIIGFNRFLYQINNAPLGIWSALEGYWLLFVFAFILIWKTKSYTWLLAFSTIILLIMISSLSLVDVTRSVAYVFPGIFLALYLLNQFEQDGTVRKILLMVLILCFFPTYYISGKNTVWLQYPLPFQLLRGWMIYGS